MLLELKYPFQQLLRAQLNVHLPSVAPLEFLARSAPARIVAPQLSRRGAARTRGCASRRHRSRLLRRTVASRASSAIGITGSTLEHLSDNRRRRSRRRVALDLDPEDPGHDRALDAVAQLVEHLQGFVLVLDQRVALSVGTQSDALAEVVHLREVLHPLPVDD